MGVSLGRDHAGTRCSNGGRRLPGRYDDWHPPATAWLWRQLMPLGSGTAPVLLFDCALYWAGVGTIAEVLRRRGRPIAMAAALLIAAAPIPFGQMGAILKDPLLAACCLLAGALILVRHRAATAVAVVLLVFASATRVERRLRHHAAAGGTAAAAMDRSAVAAGSRAGRCGGAAAGRQHADRPRDAAAAPGATDLLAGELRSRRHPCARRRERLSEPRSPPPPAR